MRWFIVRFLLFAAPLLLLLAGMEWALRRIPNNYAYTDAQLKDHGARIQIIVLGNSHTYNGVDPDALGAPAYNAANISQDHRLDRALLERYMDGLPHLKFIVLPVSNASIGSRIEEKPGSMASEELRAVHGPSRACSVGIMDRGTAWLDTGTFD